MADSAREAVDSATAWLAAPVTQPSAAVGSEQYAAFYLREYRPVVGLAYVLTGDRVLAEDLAQDAFIAAYKKWDRISSYDRPGSWVRRVVVNRSVSWRRRRAAEIRALARFGAPRPSRGFDVAADGVAVWAEVRRLPARQAQVVALVYLEDMSVANAARTLSCGEETVKTHLKRARRTLARRLGDDEETR